MVYSPGSRFSNEYVPGSFTATTRPLASQLMGCLRAPATAGQTTTTRTLSLDAAGSGGPGRGFRGGGGFGDGRGDIGDGNAHGTVFCALNAKGERASGVVENPSGGI